MKWYRLAADQGSASAQFCVGLAHQLGQGAPQSYREAERWYLLAAEQNNTEAMTNLAWMYSSENATGQIARDGVKAFMWASLAATQDNKKAQDKLKELYAALSPAEISEAQKQAREWKAAYAKKALQKKFGEP